jgi:hypothetical protein
VQATALPAPGLGTSSVSEPPTIKASYLSQELRAKRYRQRAQAQKWTWGWFGKTEQRAEATDGRDDRKPPRTARCGWTMARDVKFTYNEVTRKAGVSGVEHCASIACCPTCAPVIRAERANVISAITMEQQANGLVPVMVTFTLRHRVTDRLRSNLDILLEAYRRFSRGAPWKRFKERMGIAGSIRALEVTVGQNGWHPHLHVLYYVSKEGARAMRDPDALQWVATRWGTTVVAEGGRLPSDGRGTNVQVGDVTGEILARYVSKMQDNPKHHALSVEMARADLKNGRNLRSLNPFALLDPASWKYPGMAEWKAAKLWIEYSRAMHGRRVMSISKSLHTTFQSRILMTDEEVMAQVEAQEVVFEVTAKRYRELRRDPAVVPAILDMIELGCLQQAEDFARGEDRDSCNSPVGPSGENYCKE